MSELRSTKTKLRDYLYIDRRRLDSYLDQVSSTTTQDGCVSVEASLSMGGLSVTAGRSTRFRDKNDHEKVCELVESLKCSGQLGYRRPSLTKTDRDDIELPKFVLEECDAARIGIQSADNVQSPEGIEIWLSEWPLIRGTKAIRPAGVLCIIQDSTFDDKRHRVGFSHSGYTWAEALLYQLRQQPQRTQLSMQYESPAMGDYRYDLMSAQQCLQTEMELLRRTPLEWFKAKGCKILSLQQRITALYQIRNVGSDEIGMENRNEDFTISTFAYGIAIWVE